MNTLCTVYGLWAGYKYYYSRFLVLGFEVILVRLRSLLVGYAVRGLVCLLRGVSGFVIVGELVIDSIVCVLEGVFRVCFFV